MKKKFVLCSCACLAAAVLCLSCSKGSSIKTIELPSTPVIETSERFALVLDPYISLRDQPGEDGITVSHVRRGEIYAVTGKKLVNEGKTNAVWVNLGDGWALATSVELYSSREKAVTAAKRFQ